MVVINLSQSTEPDRFILPQWVINPLPGKTWVQNNDKKFLLHMTGIVACNLKSGDGRPRGTAPGPYTNATLRIFPGLIGALRWAWTTFQDGAPQSLRFEAEQYSTFAGLAHILNHGHSVGARYAVNNFSPIFFPEDVAGSRNLQGIKVDMELGDTDAEIARVAYQITAVGKIFSTQRASDPPIG